MSTNCFLADKRASAPFLPLIPSPTAQLLGQNDVFLVGAEQNGQAVGAAVVQLQGESAALLSIAVAEGLRRTGVGSLLLNRCLRVLRQTDAQELFCLLSEADRTQALDGFLTAWGMYRPESSFLFSYRTSLEALTGIPYLSRIPALSLMPLAQAPATLLRSCDPRLFDGDWATLEPNVSCLAIERQAVSATLLLRRRDDVLSIDWMASLSSNRLLLPALLRCALAAASERYPAQTPVVMTTINRQSHALAEKLLADCARRTALYPYCIDGADFRSKRCDLPDEGGISHA